MTTSTVTDNTHTPQEPEHGVYGWDWSATTHDVSENVVHDLVRALGARLVLPAKGLQGWTQGLEAFDRDGFRRGTVYFGGREDVHVVSTSAAAEQVRSRVVGVQRARTSRVDTRVDTMLAYDELRAICEDVAAQKARITTMESTLAGESLGRTIYVGSPSSAVRVRVYEKWLESPGQYVEGTNRVEVQLRPPSRAKESVSYWSPTDTFCASELTRRLAASLGGRVSKPGSLQKSRGVPDLERTLAAMGEQYGNAVNRWLSLGGDVDRVLDYLVPSDGLTGK